MHSSYTSDFTWLVLYNTHSDPVTYAKLTHARHEQGEPEMCAITMENIEDNSLASELCGMKASAVINGFPDFFVCELRCGHRFNALSLFCHWMKMKMRCPVCKAGSDHSLGVKSFPQEEWALRMEAIISRDEKHEMLARIHEDELAAQAVLADEVLQSMDDEFRRYLYAVLQPPGFESGIGNASMLDITEDLDIVSIVSGHTPEEHTSEHILEEHTSEHMPERMIEHILESFQITLNMGLSLVVYLYYVNNEELVQVDGICLPLRRGLTRDIERVTDFVVPFSHMRALSTRITRMGPVYMRLAVFSFTVSSDMQEIVSVEKFQLLDVFSSAADYVVYACDSDTVGRVPLFTIQPTRELQHVAGSNVIRNMSGLSSICFHLNT